jgi:hypothetical protein
MQVVDNSLKGKLTSRTEYDRVIGEAEQAYMKILESSQVRILINHATFIFFLFCIIAYFFRQRCSKVVADQL